MNFSEAMLTGHGLTLSDAFSASGMVMCVGLGIVFLVLVILMLVLYLFKVIFYKKGSDNKKTIDTTPAVDASPAVQTVQDEPEENEEELIAVLTAAVAASLNTSTYNLQIKSYRRIKDNRPSWNKEGLRETISNRF